MKRTWLIILFLFVSTYGIYFIRFLYEPHGEIKIPKIDALKGSASAVSLNLEIDQAISAAEQNHTLEKDHTRLMTYLIFPPAGVLLSLAAYIGLYLLKKRSLNPSLSRSVRRSALTLCILSLLSVLLLGIVYLLSGFRSLPLLELCTNENTKPQLVVPGGRFMAQVDYSPFVNSIQSRHQFDSIRVSNLTFKNSSGEEGSFLLKGHPQACRRTIDNPSEWPGLAQGVSKAFTMERMNDLYVFLHLPNDPRLQGSLVNGDVEGDLQYPIRSGLDEVSIRNTHVTGHVSFWVATPRQAQFVAQVGKFNEWRAIGTDTNGNLGVVFLFSLVCCLGLCIGTKDIASTMMKSEECNPSVS